MSLPTSMLWRRMPSPSVTVNELLEILTAHTNGHYIPPEEPYDEVFPGIILGDSTTALCLHLLRRLGITHVLNAAWASNPNYGMVNTSEGYYRNSAIEFYGIEALDIKVFPLFEHFDLAVEFISRAVDDGGKVLVHCGEGISRSSTLVIAYLMIKRRFRVTEAVRQVVKHRNILPNKGFLLQLCQLNDRLHSPSHTQSSGTSSNVMSLNDVQTNNHLKVVENYDAGRARSMSPSPYNTSRSSVSPLPERRSISQPVAISRLPPLCSGGASSLTTLSHNLTSTSSRSSYLENAHAHDSKYKRFSPVDRTVRATSMLRERCPSPILSTRTKWSNNWTPPTTLTGTTRKTTTLLSRPSSPNLSRYRRVASPCWSETSPSPTFSIRSRRCDSVDRMYTSGPSYLSDSYLNSDRMYSTSLLSTYISRPLTIR